MDTGGFIGLGNRGSGMAGNIQQASYALVVYDTRPEAMGIKAGGINVDRATSRPTLVRQIEPLFRQKRASVLDAPVMGVKAGVDPEKAATSNRRRSGNAHASKGSSRAEAERS